MPEVYIIALLVLFWELTVSLSTTANFRCTILEKAKFNLACHPATCQREPHLVVPSKMCKTGFKVLHRYVLALLVY